MTPRLSHTLVFSLCLGSSFALIACKGETSQDANAVQPASLRSEAAAPAPQTPPTTVQPVQADPAVDQLPPVKSPPAQPMPLPTQQPIDPASITVKIDQSNIDFGEIPTGDSATRTVRLINTGDKPATIITHRVTCGCTALDLAPNYVLGPKEVKEIKVQLNGGAVAGPLTGKKVTFVIDGQPEVEVVLNAMAVSFVMQEPAVITPESHPDGKVTLKSRDGEPFRILSMQPPVVIEFAKEAAAEHTIEIDWEKYREFGVSRKAMFFFDHPKCQNMMANIQFSTEELKAEQERMMARKMQNQGDATVANQNQFINTAPMDPNALLAQMIQQGNNAEVLKRIAEGLDPETRNQQGESLLSVAAKYGNVDLMSALLNVPVNMDATDNSGRTPLMHAATSKNVEAVRLLLDRGASVSTRDTLGSTALSWASGFGDAASVKELLDAGADVEVVSRITGWTPMIWASGFGDPNSIPLLAALGANVEATDFLEGATPMVHAARTAEVASLKALITAGAKLETPDLNGNTPLLSAARNSGGNADKVKFLVEAGANLRAKDNRGMNALALARKRTDPRGPDVVKYLEPLLGSETPTEVATPAAASATPVKPAVQPGHEGHDHSGHNHGSPGSGQ